MFIVAKAHGLMLIVSEVQSARGRLIVMLTAISRSWDDRSLRATRDLNVLHACYT